MGMGVLHGCVYGSSRLMSAIFLVLFFHISYNGRVSLSQANPVFANMVDFTGYLALWILCPSLPRLELSAGHHIHLAVPWVLEIQILVLLLARPVI